MLGHDADCGVHYPRSASTWAGPPEGKNISTCASLRIPLLACATVLSAFGQANFSLCDVNHDGTVNVKDAQAVTTQSLGAGSASASADFSADGAVNLVDIQTAINNVLYGCPFYSATPRFVIANVTVLNQAWNPSQIPSAGDLTLRSASASQVSLINQFWNPSQIPSPGNLAVHAATTPPVTLVNQFWNPSEIPSPGNVAIRAAIGPPVSLVNQFWNPAQIPSPGKITFAAGLLVSVKNNGGGGALPLLSFDGRRIIAGGSSTAPVDFATLQDGQALLTGQTVRLRLYPPDAASTGADFRINGAPIDLHTPFEVLLTAPAGVTALDVEAALFSESGRSWRSAVKHLLVVPDPGLSLNGRALRDDRAANSIPVGVRVNGLIAEYSPADHQPAAWPDVPRPAARHSLVTAVNQPETTLFGPDPFGTGIAGPFIGRFHGQILVASAGNHEFFLGPSLGARLVLDGKTIVDSAPGTFSPELSAVLELTEGWHSLEILSYQTPSQPGLRLSWKQPNSVREVVPPEALAADSDPVAVSATGGLFHIASFPAILHPLDWHSVPADKQVHIVLDPPTSERLVAQ